MVQTPQAPMLSSTMMEPPTPLGHQLDTPSGGPMSMAPPYMDAATPGGPLSVAPPYMDPQTPAGSLSMGQSYMDQSVNAPFLDSHNSVAPPFMDPNTPAPTLDHDLPDLPIDQVCHSFKL